MNWKQHPGLFCNGKFQIMGMRGPGLFTMYCNVSELLTYQTQTHSYPHDVHLDNARLIARKIEDMTSEEKQHYKSLLRVPKYNALETPESFLYLLTIGILPKQLKTDNVIFTNERDMEDGS